jgi:hypothetical protein
VTSNLRRGNAHPSRHACAVREALALSRSDSYRLPCGSNATMWTVILPLLAMLLVILTLVRAINGIPPTSSNAD